MKSVTVVRFQKGVGAGGEEFLPNMFLDFHNFCNKSMLVL